MKARASPASSVTRNLLVGAAAGGALGVALLVVGLVRFGFHLLTGGSSPPFTASDARPMGIYVLAFVLGGALVGLVRPLVRSRGGAYAVFAVAGALVMNVGMLTFDGWRELGGTGVVIATVTGAIFGLAFAYGLLKND